MPIFVQVLLWIAGAITALVTIWKTVAKPIVMATIQTQVTLPVIHAMVIEFKDDLSKLNILGEIAERFPGNGSSLPSSLDRIEKELIELRTEMQTEIGVNREQMSHVAARTDRIDAATLRVDICCWDGCLSCCRGS